MQKPEFLIYRSSAGSGKTQTLAAEYLKLVLSGRSGFRHVLAITFTNKAAGEMKERVLQLLRLFGTEAPLAGYHQKLLEEIAVSAGVSPPEISLRAKEVHKEILHHYSDFNIGTIDSFVHRIIRSFALELNLSFAFEVQLETSSFIGMAVDDLLAEAGEDKELTAALVGFTRNLLEDEKSWNIEQALTRFATFLTSEVSIEPLSKLADAVHIDIRNVAKSNRKAIEEIKASWIQRLTLADQKVKACGVPADKFSYANAGGVPGFFARMIEQQEFGKLFRRAGELSRMVGFMEGDVDFFPKKSEEHVKAPLTALKEELIPIWELLIRDVELHYPEFALRQLVQENLSALSLSRKIREQMQITMDRENLIPIYEFNRLIWNIIRNQPVPFIYERTSERFDHFLIDEFQDTSALQWLNLLPLIENSLSQGGMNMVVGDAKQAIYRWRNGDVWQFVKLPELVQASNNPLIRERQEALQRFARIENLNHNYRSSREIINFNNRFFEWMTSRYPNLLGEIYHDHHQKFPPDAPKGYVEIHLIPEPESKIKSEFHKLTVAATLTKVQDLLQEKGGDLRPSDICILVRKNHEAGLVASALIEAGIDVVSSQSFMLGSFSEPLFFRALIGLLLNRTDGVSAAVMATTMERNKLIGEHELHDAFNRLQGYGSYKQSLWPWIDQLFAVAGFENTMELYLAMPLYEMCETVIRDAFRNRVSAPAAHYLLDLTAAFIQSSGNDLAAYAAHLDEKLATSVPLPETTHAVNVITIHKAKGLQFPVVIYAFAEENPDKSNHHQQLLWIEDPDEEVFDGLPVLLLPLRSQLADTPYASRLEMEKSALFQDAVNVVYVALTRPSQRLYVITSPNGRNSKSTNHFYNLFSEYVSESPDFVSDDGIVYSYGNKEPLHVRKDEGAEGERFRMKPWASYPWNDRLGIRTGHLTSAFAEPRQSAIDRGVVIHAVLARINRRNEVESALVQCQTEGLIRPEEFEIMRKDILEVIDMEGVASFFADSNKPRNESPIVVPGGRILIPDRVVELEDCIAVIDFKTGKPHSGHQRQVTTYCEMLRGMGHPSVKGFLLYISSKTLVEVQNGQN
jgi:ATP-dependent exoDNAse (exonuclease V) beta subunit